MPTKVSEEVFIHEYLANEGTYKDLAERLGLSQRTVYKRIKSCVEKGKLNKDRAVPNWKPGSGRKITKVSTQLDRDGTPTSYSVQEMPQLEDDVFADPLARPVRVSTLRGADGQIRAQWEITTPGEEEAANNMKEMAEALSEDITRIEPTPTEALLYQPDLTNLYVLSDAHIGGLSWAPEVGDDWDLAIAEVMFTKAMATMIHASPSASNAIVALLGDWMHYDKFEAVTTLSGNILDSDGRRGKMNKTAIRIARRVVNEALLHHETVTLLVAEGNHDIIAANWLRELFIVAFENEPRVTVVEDERPYYAVLVGDVFVGFHHGHYKSLGKAPKNAEDLTAIFADEFREMWGQAKKVYIHTGHLHYATEVEPRGARVIQHPTLATRDAYAARRGWGSLREARGITYHSRWGQTGTVNISPEMLDEV